MDAGKRSKALGSETEVLIPHSTASSISISMLTSVALGTPSAPQVPQGETEGQMEACTRSGLRYRKGTLSLRNLLFYCRRWASLLLVLERVPQGYSGQKQAWKMAQVKSSQGLAFLAYAAKRVGVEETPLKIVLAVWMSKTEFTNFLKTCFSVSSLGEGYHLLPQSPKAKPDSYLRLYPIICSPHPN